MFCLHPDVYLTRRQRLHFVMDHKGELAWSGKNIMSALEFLASADQMEFRVAGQDDQGAYRVKIRAD